MKNGHILEPSSIFLISWLTYFVSVAIYLGKIRGMCLSADWDDILRCQSCWTAHNFSQSYYYFFIWFIYLLDNRFYFRFSVLLRLYKKLNFMMIYNFYSIIEKNNKKIKKEIITNKLVRRRKILLFN